MRTRLLPSALLLALCVALPALAGTGLRGSCCNGGCCGGSCDGTCDGSGKQTPPSNPPQQSGDNGQKQ
ncbi:MAG: hypothetical protein ABSH53_11455 [Holophaga sp.]|jgi:hypothetical protein